MHPDVGGIRGGEKTISRAHRFNVAHECGPNALVSVIRVSSQCFDKSITKECLVGYNESDGVNVNSGEPALLVHKRLLQVICQAIIADNHCLDATDTRMIGSCGGHDNYA